MLKRLAMLVRGAGFGASTEADCSAVGLAGSVGKTKSSGEGCGTMSAESVFGLGMYCFTAGAGRRVCGCGTA